MRPSVVVIALLFLTACDAGSPPPTPTPIAPITLEGTGSGDTTRFILPAGDFTILWTTRSNTNFACSLIGLLIPNDDAIHGYEFGHNNEGQTRVNGVQPATYYVHASVGTGSCGWTIGIQPAP
jgi:hypothetical protein